MPDCARRDPAFALFARVDVPARHRLRVRPLVPFGVSIWRDCASVTCVQGANGIGVDTHINDTRTTQGVVVALHLAQATFPLPAELQVALEPLRDEDLCDGSPRITTDTTLRLTQSPVGIPRCGGRPGSEAAFGSYLRLRVAPGRRVEVTAPTALLRLVRDCDEGACFNDVGAAPWASFTNRDAREAERVILATNGSNFGPHDVRVAFLDPPPRAQCDTAPALFDGDRVEGIAPQDAGEPELTCGVPRAAVWHRVQLPAGHVLEATVTGGVPASTRLSVVTACGEATCLAPIDEHASVRARIARFINPRTTPLALRLGLSGMERPVDLEVRVRPPSPETTCETAPRLADGARLPSERLRDVSDPRITCGGNPVRGRFYRVTVPAQHRVEATISGAANHSVLAEVLGGCGPDACLAQARSDGADAFGVGWTNLDAVPRDVRLVIHEALPSLQDPPADVGGSIAVRPPVPHATCAGALSLPDHAPHRDHTREAREAAPRCDGSSAPALFYRVTVPAGQRVRVRTSDARASGVSLRATDRCGGTTCLAADDLPNSTARDIVWRHEDLASRDLLLAVSRTSADTAFTIRADLETPGPNGRCAAATPLAAGAGEIVQAFDDARELASRCDGSGLADPAVFFRTEVPAGAYVVWHAREDGGTSPRLSVLDACGGLCLASGDLGVVSFWNRGEARTVIVALRGAAPARRAAVYRVYVTR